MPYEPLMASRTGRQWARAGKKIELTSSPFEGVNDALGIDHDAL
jgi:hypothetical protein